MTKDTTKKQAEAKPEAKKRVVLTPEQRIAKMEADLRAERLKLQAKAKAKLADAQAELTKLKQRQTEINDKVSAQESVVASLETQAGTQDEAPASS